jgi:Zn-dependent protease with chaperone function
MYIFWIAAVAGSIFFILRVAVSIVGGFDGDTADELDATDGAFKLLSLNSVTSFVAIFGWVGLASFYQFKLSLLISVGIAVIFGFLAMLITTWLFRLAMKLKSGGAVFDIKDTVGQIGEVYIRIPLGGVGRIIFTTNGIKHEFDAIAENESIIDSFERVVITRVIDSHTVAVRPIINKEK